MADLFEKGLIEQGADVVVGRAPSPRGNLGANVVGIDLEMRNGSVGEIIWHYGPAACDAGGVEMPCREPPLGINAGAVVIEAGRSKIPADHVFLALPHDVDRRPGQLRSAHGILDKINLESAAEPSADASNLGGDVFFRNSQDARGDATPVGRCLHGAEQVRRVGLHIGKHIDRLHRSVGEERHLVGGLDHAVGLPQCSFNVTHLAPGFARSVRDRIGKGLGESI